MCLLVTRAPTTHLTPSATEELDNITSLFDSSASSCRSTAKLIVGAFISYDFNQLKNELQSSVQNLRRKAHEVLGLPHTRFHHHHDENPTITITELDRLNGKTHLFANESGNGNPSTTTSAGGAMDSRSRATSVTISDITDGHPPAPFHMLLTDEMHPTLAQDVRDFSIRSNSSHYTAPASTTSAMASTSASASMSVSSPPLISRAMSFYDHPSEHTMEIDTLATPLGPSRTPPPPTPHRETPEYISQPRPSFHRHSSGPNPRIEPPPQMQYFHSSVQHDSLGFLSAGSSGGGGAGNGDHVRRATSGSSTVNTGFQQIPSGFHNTTGGFPTITPSGGMAPLPTGFAYSPSSYGGWGIGSTGGGGFGAGNSPIVLDSSWNTLVEQLGFAIG